MSQVKPEYTEVSRNLRHALDHNDIEKVHKKINQLISAAVNAQSQKDLKDLRTTLNELIVIFSVLLGLCMLFLCIFVYILLRSIDDSDFYHDREIFDYIARSFYVFIISLCLYGIILLSMKINLIRESRERITKIMT